MATAGDLSPQMQTTIRPAIPVASADLAIFRQRLRWSWSRRRLVRAARAALSSSSEYEYTGALRPGSGTAPLRGGVSLSRFLIDRDQLVAAPRTGMRRLELVIGERSPCALAVDAPTAVHVTPLFVVGWLGGPRPAIGTVARG